MTANLILHDTIAAIATPHGEGGISVIRISGNKAFSISEKIFFRDKKGLKKIDIKNTQSHTVHFGYIIKEREIIDEALLTVFKKPESYTGEDVAEISSHGGILVTNKILEYILECGARLAEPGEFTKRAFLNGKKDLSQAEAVADLIKARTEEAHNASIKQLEGSLSEYVGKVRKELIDVTSLIELELDFAEEDVDFAKKDELKKRCTELKEELNTIIDTFITGKVIRSGINTVIAGRPNSGKSSLFNELLNSDRAIVSNISGTTRDYIEESIIIKGIQFNLTDTAGLRLSDDIIETEGIKRSYRKISDADFVLYLIDSSEDDNTIREEIKYFEENFNPKKSLLIFTKADIKSEGFDKLKSENIEAEEISLKEQITIENLKSRLAERFGKSGFGRKQEGIIITNIRHKVCLENAVRSIEELLASMEKGMSGEFLSVDLRNAMSHLGEITGEITNDDVLNNIFKNFCIGK